MMSWESVYEMLHVAYTLAVICVRLFCGTGWESRQVWKIGKWWHFPLADTGLGLSPRSGDGWLNFLGMRIALFGLCFFLCKLGIIILYVILWILNTINYSCMQNIHWKTIFSQALFQVLLLLKWVNKDTCPPWNFLCQELYVVSICMFTKV